MPFLKGQEHHTIDNKGRVNIPAKMRKSVSPDANDTFVITRSVDKCIEAYPLDEWRKKEARFEKLNQYNTRNRNFLRKVLMWSEEVVLDGQQRITIPKKLLEFANITSKVISVGMGDHIEIWDPVEFNKKMEEDEEPYEVVAELVMAPEHISNLNV
ncbi:MAG: division/cell wall cluster transcriptional repressor MraZ [FCB group bacterium]|jgi:MraZ protein